ncbi:MAG: hypothetical protein ACN6O6_24060 [Pseudomonas sp.]|uniref:hypothetical protein n=1 Tax=Pseudomonas sp. TaxID=306 RepID=UPI003D0B47E2
MFNKQLKKELEALREEYSKNQQIKESIYEEMLVLELDARARSCSPTTISSRKCSTAART